MNKFLKICFVFAFLSICLPVLASDLRPYMPRAGVNGKIEQKTIESLPITVSKTPIKTDFAENKIVTANKDEEIKNITGDIKDELKDEQEKTLSDLRILWKSAVGKSETIRFAILKLSNPEGEVEKKSTVKKILEPIAGLAPVFGSNSANPIAGASSVLGGGLLGSILSDDSFIINNSLSRVSDADLVLLAQEIDNLQQKLVNLYYGYRNSVEKLTMVDKIVQNRYKYYESSQKSTVETIAVADVFYREALDLQYKTRQEVLNSRISLEQLVGNDAIVEIDKNSFEKSAAILDKQVNN